MARARGRVAGMKKRREARRFWTEIVSRYEKAGQPQNVFASGNDVGLAALRYWICKLRREAKAAKVRPELRLVPVRVEPQAVATAECAGRVEIRLGDLSVRVPVGTDPRYLASIVAAVRAAPC